MEEMCLDCLPNSFKDVDLQDYSKKKIIKKNCKVVKANSVMAKE